MKDRMLRTLLWVIGIVTVLIVVLMIYARAVSKVPEPENISLADTAAVVLEPVPGLHKLGKNWFRQSESGLYELYVEGEPFERGLANGKLTRALVQYQEVSFTSQIARLVPNGFYRDALKYFIGWFNRDLSNHVIDEYKAEIYGVSQSASHEFDDIGEPYQRILNYHAAHDIGHALQNMSLVGCTSFATWNERSKDSTLIVGRNFDFYVGDDFARDKIIAFYKPSQGHGFVMVTFGGMTGVVSGMNDQGLTVTINAAKSDIPSASATPVSLVAREILQYASNIKEAYAIAKKRRMFVAESFLIGSAKDKRAAVIEKSIDGIDLVESSFGQIISTNHFRGDTLGSTEINQEHMRTSASPYRYARVAELLAGVEQNTVEKTADILRNQKGLEGADIGMGNEKVINQLVAHHAVIFQPEEGLMWISTAPWQLGKFVCYDLHKILSLQPVTNDEIYEGDRTIAADSFTQTKDYKQYLKFHVYRFPFAPRVNLNPDSVIAWNPHNYHSYMLAGDYYLGINEWAKAAETFSQGLTMEVATVQEREYMERQVAECKEKLK